MANAQTSKLNSMPTEASSSCFPDNLPAHWKKLLASEKDEAYFQKLSRFLKEEKKRYDIQPASHQILRALQAVDYPDVRVVILGQDPYPTKGHAVGLCFAVPNEVSPKPPSLLNLFKEIETDLNVSLPPQQSDLTGWAKQGVLLLNTALTVRVGRPLSHQGQGWELFTAKIIQLLNQRKEPLIFLLWGGSARKKKSLIDSKRHYILEAAHPSPLSAYRGFLGCRHFTKANAILEKKLKYPLIDWTRISNS